MSNEVTVVNENEKAGKVATVEDYKKIAIHWLESTGNLNKFNDVEKNQFIDICAAFNLNPIKKEVYGVLYNGKNGRKFNLIIGYESYIKRAEKSGRLDGWSVEVVGSGSNMKAVITIYRKDFTKPFIHEVYFEEYNTGRDLWLNKPRTMLRKVAIAQGFRMCFSEDLGGLPYTREELGDLAAAQPVEVAETAPTVKAETTPIKSENTPKTLAEKAAEAQEVEVVTPGKNRDDLLKIKLYTKEQAEELAAVMNMTYNNGAPIFSDEEKASYRNMLVNGEFVAALKAAKDTLVSKLDGAGVDLAAEVESELDN